MVVCKCRKATKLYCFVHKVPVCGECVCFPEHQICVVGTYSEWVIDGEYNWPPNCCHCQVVLEEGPNTQTTRLGCLHVIHTSCLVSHIKSFPLHTTPAGYICPKCSTAIWPPKSVKDSGSRLHSMLKEAILQTGLENNLFGNHPVSFVTGTRSPPPAFASKPLVHHTSVGLNAEGPTMPTNLDVVKIDGLSTATSSLTKGTSPAAPGATPRKNTPQGERLNSEAASYYADDEDTSKKKYSRRGTFRHKVLRSLLPFWSSALPTLPVTVPPRKDMSHTEDAPEGRARHQKPSRMDPRKLLLIIAIMACMATMGILYYRIAQPGLGEDSRDDEFQ